MEKDWNDFKILAGGLEGARSKFPTACETVLRKMYPDENVQIVRPNPGDYGVDIYIGEYGVNPIKVFQCKFFLDDLGESQKEQIRGSFNTAASSEEFEMIEWTLMLPKTLDSKEHKWWAGWKVKQKRLKVAIKLMNGNELIDLMKEHEVYSRAFNIESDKILQEIHEYISNIKVADGKKDEDGSRRAERAIREQKANLEFLSDRIKNSVRANTTLNRARHFDDLTLYNSLSFQVEQLEKYIAESDTLSEADEEKLREFLREHHNYMNQDRDDEMNRLIRDWREDRRENADFFYYVNDLQVFSDEIHRMISLTNMVKEVINRLGEYDSGRELGK